MNNKSAVTVTNTSTLGDIVSSLFGIVAIAIGIINTFWGNDPGYGIFIFLLAFAFFPPVTAFATKITGITIRLWMKLLLGAFILWSALGVGELFDKIELMRQSFQ